MTLALTTTNIFRARVNATSSHQFGPNSDGLGFFSVGRRGATSADAFGDKNGAPLAVTTVGGASVAVRDGTLRLGHVALTAFNSRQWAADVIGAGLTDAEQLTVYNALHTYMIVVGASA